MLPDGDKTPPGFCVTVPGWKELVKRPARRLLYPPLNALRHVSLARRYGHLLPVPIDLWLWGQRGNDYERHRARVARHVGVNGARVLVAGCGTGRDVESWLPLRPRTLLGVDYFSYGRAWEELRTRWRTLFPGTQVSFCQASLLDLSPVSAGSIDVVGSDAVLEHVNDVPRMLAEFHRVLRIGGILYATFGPLWFCWGGDHISGYDGDHNGYAHLLMSAPEYDAYVAGIGPPRHSEDDGRTWLHNDLFSRLRPIEYINLIEAGGFERVFVSAMVEPIAVRCLSSHAEVRAALAARGHHFIDLVIGGMTIIYRRR